MAERMNIPIAADLLSKSAVPENHPLYLGVYGGAMSSDEHVRKYVESADLVLMLGTFITDMSMVFTQRNSTGDAQFSLHRSERAFSITVMIQFSFAISSKRSPLRRSNQNSSSIPILTRCPSR